MSGGTLYLRNGKAFLTGEPDDASIAYSGEPPEFVIRVTTKAGVHHFANAEEAYNTISEENLLKVEMIPVSNTG